MGRTLTLDNDIDVAVTGIVENNRLNSSVKYDFLLSMETARRLYGWTDDWEVNNQTPFVVSYFLLKQFLGWAWAYTTEISVFFFVLAGLMTLVFAVLSLSSTRQSKSIYPTPPMPFAMNKMVPGIL